MSEFSIPGYVLAALFVSVLFSLTAIVVPSRGAPAMFGLVAAVVLLETFRGAWPFGGVPVATVGETQVGGPIAQVARVGGGLLITAVVVTIGVVGAAAVRGRRVGPAVSGVVVIGLVVVATGLGGLTKVGTLRAAAVQGGGERGTRAVDSSPRDVMQAHVDATDTVGAGVDLVLWPEDVVDVPRPILESPQGQVVSSIAKRLETTLVVGVVEDTTNTRFVNSAKVWGPDGQPGDSYTKVQRVPFGEYIPFREFVAAVADVSAVPRDATVGHGPGLLTTSAGDLGVVISYEVFFARRARDAMLVGGQVLLVPTNASSYTTTQMPALELGAARLRAIETGRWVLQAAPTGFSAVVDPDGDVHQHSDLGAREVLTADLELLDGETPYTRFGDGPFVVAAGIALIVAWIWNAVSALWRQRKARRP